VALGRQHEILHRIPGCQEEFFCATGRPAEDSELGAETKKADVGHDISIILDYLPALERLGKGI
jgi:hypothetical protein